MQAFNITRTTQELESFRANKLIGMFDLHKENYTQTFEGVFELPEQWNIGVIVGRSGTGKTTIAKELFTLSETNFDKNVPIIDAMPQDQSVEEITKVFTNVGFSSPPSWLKPYNVLSNGEKMRVDLAYHLLSNARQIVFDEFTSVVDRDVAKVCSMVVQKTVRKENKQFIALTCHYDVLEFLEPDWVFSTDEMKMIQVEKKRSPINIEVHEGEVESWKIFRKYHYMNASINPSAQVYVATLWGKIVGFCAILHFPHPVVQNMKKITRLVVLPDYQGIGIGKSLLNFVAKVYKEKNFRVTITTSHPAINKSLNKDWLLTRQGRVAGNSRKSTLQELNKTFTKDRMTCTWEYIGQSLPKS